MKVETDVNQTQHFSGDRHWVDVNQTQHFSGDRHWVDVKRTTIMNAAMTTPSI